MGKKCEICGNAIRYFKEIRKPNKKYLRTKNLKTKKFLEEIMITPHSNSKGIVTHHTENHNHIYYQKYGWYE